VFLVEALINLSTCEDHPAFSIEFPILPITLMNFTIVCDLCALSLHNFGLFFPLPQVHIPIWELMQWL
jgi:hypothetical protein